MPKRNNGLQKPALFRRTRAPAKFPRRRIRAQPDPAHRQQNHTGIGRRAGAAAAIKEKRPQKRQVATHTHRRRSAPPRAGTSCTNATCCSPASTATATSKRHAAAGLAPLGSDPLSNALFRFRRQWPGIELTFLEQGSLAIEQSCATTNSTQVNCFAPVHEDFDSIPCDYLACRPHAAHPSPPCRPQPQSLQHEPFILLASGFSLNETIQTACRSQGFTPTSSAAPTMGPACRHGGAHHMVSPFCPNTTPANQPRTPSPPSR